MANNTESDDEPLASREGMVGEVFATAAVYPMILVVVQDDDSRRALREMIQSESEEMFSGLTSQCEITFVKESDVEKYRGNVPVFYDPAMFRDAA